MCISGGIISSHKGHREGVTPTPGRQEWRVAPGPRRTVAGDCKDLLQRASDTQTRGDLGKYPRLTGSAVLPGAAPGHEGVCWSFRVSATTEDPVQPRRANGRGRNDCQHGGSCWCFLFF